MKSCRAHGQPCISSATAFVEVVNPFRSALVAACGGPLVTLKAALALEGPKSQAVAQPVADDCW